MLRRHFLFLPGVIAGAAGCAVSGEQASANPYGPQAPPRKVTVVEFDSSGRRLAAVTVDQVVRTEREWRDQLSDRAYLVTREKGTEFAFSGRYDKHYGEGIYRCVCCGNALFSSETKFNSGTGWPSFWAPIAEENLYQKRDLGYGMIRQEVLCTRCDAHLGHVFNDGPAPTGLRYCINSAALVFEKSA